MAGDIEITDAMREAVARAIATEHYADRFDKPNDDEHVLMNVEANWSTWLIYANSIIAALAPIIAKAAKAEAREACAKIADKHLARVPDHCPDREMEDLVAQGYGNAALNIAAAIRSMEVE